MSNQSDDQRCNCNAREKNGDSHLVTCPAGGPPICRYCSSPTSTDNFAWDSKTNTYVHAYCLPQRLARRQLIADCFDDDDLHERGLPFHGVTHDDVVGMCNPNEGCK